MVTPDSTEKLLDWCKKDFSKVTNLVMKGLANYSRKNRFTIIQCKEHEILFSKNDTNVGRNIYEYLRIIDAHMTGAKCLATFGME